MYEDVPFSHFLFPGCALVASVVFGIRSIAVLRGYNTQIRQRFSNIDDISLLWLSYATFGFVGIWGLRLMGVGVISAYPALLLVGTMVVLGLSHRTHGRDPDNEAAKIEEPDRNTKICSEKVVQLVDLMQRVKVYKDLNLGLDDLADSMDTSPRSLSSLINGHFGKNFYDFVNHYRVIDAKLQLEDSELFDKSIQRVFEDAGFNSKSTFNTIFKRATGCTPSAYRRRFQTEIHTGQDTGKLSI
jgi:AraC-like DNA-binding protein